MSVIRTRMALLLAFAIAAPAAAHAQIDSGRVPLKTALTELNTFRAAYADFYNKKDAAGLAAMYAPDASSLLSDGTVLSGIDAIKAYTVKMAPMFPHLVITAETTVVFGNSAIEQGTLTYHPATGATVVERYLVVLRRGMKDWSLLRTAAVTAAK